MSKLKLSGWKRAVIKVGSGIIAPEGKCSTRYLLPIAGFISESINSGKEIILVSSGAVAAGLTTQPALSKKNHRSIPEKQALAAIGQSILISLWSRFFDFPCSQILLTYDDIHNRRRFVNAKNTLNKLIELGTLPIINENDSVATEELKVGDNDNLAAYVAMLTEADLLIICSDIDGLYNADPKRKNDVKLISVVNKITDDIFSLAGKSKNPVATGGMKTKIEAAQKATNIGIDTIIINATKKEVFDDLAKGKVRGTLFKKATSPVNARKHWLLHALESKGKIYIDKGAENAILKKGASLLPSGITRFEGEFKQGDAVDIYKDGSNLLKPIAKGITQYNSSDLSKIKGRKSVEIEKLLGFVITEEVIHRDELIITETK
ncbi:gamma-glutamyl kinase [Melioribacter roseus P3M-2]|uniref:Glutamate 5-kinase n=1 Tax=Melioribacter roseus (strain DSM 23840 / JCM 17771 / VKM B-2668 / P3M-2) TaxID=1191523 RepID=I6ZR32_MELRP|nr:glutamate 5-kinase [Melioribacter roseus]AFN74519.1 gamma-glutamyl kinase [Melioribacter roseus P3M-2]